jgi:hypothetical protein
LSADDCAGSDDFFERKRNVLSLSLSLSALPMSSLEKYTIILGSYKMSPFFAAEKGESCLTSSFPQTPNVFSQLSSCPARIAIEKELGPMQILPEHIEC